MNHQKGIVAGAWLASLACILLRCGFLWAGGLPAAEPNVGRWEKTGSLHVKRGGHTLIALPDGRALAIGGMTVEKVQANTVTRGTNTCELYDPKTGTWTATGSMHHKYGNSAAVMLKSGKVLVMGRGGHPYRECELYDPATEKWAATGALIDARSEPVPAILLPNGTVLVAGGWTGSKSLSSCELYDPATGAWARTGAMHHPCVWHQVVLLSTGRVLALAGDASRKSCELYDPKTGSWTMTTPLNAERQQFLFATSLPNGKVLVAGGNNQYGGPGPGKIEGKIEIEPVNSCELFDPTTGTWQNTAALPAPRTTLDSTATILPDGSVLLVGGRRSTGCHLYDVQTSTWKTLAPPLLPRSGHAAALLSDGRLMISGGSKGGPDSYESTLTSCEFFRSAAPPATQPESRPATQPALDLDETARLLVQKVGGKWEVRTRKLESGRELRYIKGEVVFSESEAAWNHGRAPVDVFPFAPDAEGRRIIGEFYKRYQAPFAVFGVGARRMAVSWLRPPDPALRKVMEALDLQPPEGGVLWPDRDARSQPASAPATQ